MPRRPTPGSLPTWVRAAARGVVLLLLVAAAGLAAAGPAAAAQDPARPSATVTRGPSCEPGGIEITIVAGTVPYRVVLATTRRPQGEDAADVPSGATALLHSGDVDWGETVDSRLLYTAKDGSGTAYTDELDDWTMTRPSYADCAALAAPASGSASPAATTAASSAATTAGTPSGSGTPAGTGAPGSTTSTPGSGGSAPVPPSPSDGGVQGPSAVVSSGAAAGDGAAGRAVGAGRPITVRGSGFFPGEDVVLRAGDTGAVLAQGSAVADGSVRLALTVPAHASGTTRLDLVGRASQTTVPLQLQVAASRSGLDDGRRPFSLPPLAALLALLVSGGGLVTVSRRARAVRGHAAMRGA